MAKMQLVIEQLHTLFNGKCRERVLRAFYDARG